MERIKPNLSNFFTYLLLVLIIVAGNDALGIQTAENRYALLIGGLGGESRYSEKFYQLLADSRKALVDDFHFPPNNVMVLAEPRYQNETWINGTSSADQIRKMFVYFSERLTQNDHIYIILFGHGNYDGKNAKVNIPRHDLNDEDFAELLDMLKANRIVFINTASASYPFIQKLSSRNRIIITATNRPTQRNVTVFPEYFIQALTDPASDLDKNGDLSVLEIFNFASQKTGRFYSENNHLATEFAMLEDTGDKRAFRESELQNSGEGILAGVTYLRRQGHIAASGESVKQDSILINLLKEKEQIELEIARLKNQKDRFDEQVYYEKLEALLVRLAKINDRLEEKNH